MANDTTSATSTSQDCTYTARMPIIPDGNVATEDELLAAKNRIKLYQDHLLNFRDCLLQQEIALDKNAPDYEEKRKAILAKSNESIEHEQKVADKFNKAINIYKNR